MPTASFQSVLYVDDDADICSVVETTLQVMLTCRVETATSGAQAIALAAASRPDLILLDVMMPGLDGPSTFGRLRANPATAAIPVIFMTAKVLPVEVAQFVALGAIGVIGKPFDPLTLGQQLLGLWAHAHRGSPTPVAQSGRAGLVKADSLADSFLERTRSDFGRLAQLWERGRGGDLGACSEVELLAHSIHGAGALFGFPAISAAARAVEHGAQGLAAGKTMGLPPMEHSLADLAAALDAGVNSGAGWR
jgi:two-component system OmpR family response regulator